jgi:hypothetical protein
MVFDTNIVQDNPIFEGVEIDNSGPRPTVASTQEVLNKVVGTSLFPSS